MDRAGVAPNLGRYAKGWRVKYHDDGQLLRLTRRNGNACDTLNSERQRDCIIATHSG